MALAMNKEELSHYLAEVFPQVHKDFVIEDLTEDTITMRLIVEDRHLRPGGNGFRSLDVRSGRCLRLRDGSGAEGATVAGGHDKQLVGFLAQTIRRCRHDRNVPVAKDRQNAGSRGCPYVLRGCGRASRKGKHDLFYSTSRVCSGQIWMKKGRGLAPAQEEVPKWDWGSLMHPEITLHFSSGLMRCKPDIL